VSGGVTDRAFSAYFPFSPFLQRGEGRYGGRSLL
jgi:hypothetical protein